MRAAAFAAVVLSTLVATPATVAQAAARCTPGTASGLQTLMASLPTYGDGNVSAALENGRCVILTGDALTRAGGPGPHSTITVLSAGAAHVVAPDHPGTDSRYQALPDRADGTVDWLGPAFFAEGRLYSLASRVRPRPGGWDNVAINTAVFTVPVGKDPVFSRFMPTPSIGGGSVQWAAGVHYDRVARMVYIFGTSAAPTDGWTGFDAYVARVRLADLGTPTRWTYFDGSAWVASRTSARPILRSAVNGGTESAFSATLDSQGWHITSKRGGAWGPGSVTRWTATQFGRPWSERSVAQVVGDHYLHFEHWALPLTVNGKRLLSYNTAGQAATWRESG